MNKEEMVKELNQIKNHKQNVWLEDEIIECEKRILWLERDIALEENKQLKEEKCEMKHLNDLYEQALKDYEELQQRIDKAIEYIEKNTERDYLEYYSGYKNVIESEKLLEMLKGDSNE